MGPPALVVAASNRRSTRASSESPEVQHFPRRFPRTGTTFQCKVAVDHVNLESYVTLRRAPDIMSEDFPYRPAADMEKKVDQTFASSEGEGKAQLRFRRDTRRPIKIRS